jgi:hypothetical protein
LFRRDALRSAIGKPKVLRFASRLNEESTFH